MAKINLEAFAEKDLAAYQKFAKENWGNTYQSDKNYLDWLYKENPSKNKKASDFTLAKDSITKEIIGVIHKMRLCWKVNNNIIEIPALHNLLVTKKYRKGSGLFLITSSLQGEEHIFIPGVLPPLSKAYEILGSQETPLYWFRKLINPLNILKNYGKKYLEIPKKYQPTREQINHARKILETNLTGPDWNEEQFYWRFFHPKGPKHLIFQEQDDVLIVSVGIRKSIPIARLIDGKLNSPNKKLLKNVEQTLNKLGIVLLFAHVSKEIANNLEKSGWKSQKTKVRTYIYHKNKNNTFSNYSFNGSAGDFGLESIQTVFV